MIIKIKFKRNSCKNQLKENYAYLSENTYFQNHEREISNMSKRESRY